MDLFAESLEGEGVTVQLGNWAFDRKESELGKSLTSKWICPARSGRVGCSAIEPDNVQMATDLGLPQIIPPDDVASRPCCSNKTMDFTPTPDDPDHQRKLMQREYFGSERWRKVYKRRALVEGTFGILKNGSRLRLRRDQTRIPGLAMATLVAALKVSLYNEEQLRLWHDRTGLGPTEHPLLQPEPRYWGFQGLTQAEAQAIDARHLQLLLQPSDTPAEAA